ncbi:MAG: hypothetical protein LRY36_01985 [Alphaproteobacteria bacterium]|nr:hypothetical protein [Alphaproteobacteria bacterium]
MEIVRLSPEKAAELQDRLEAYRAENPGFQSRFPYLSFSKPENYYGATSNVTVPDGLTKEEFNKMFVENFEPERAARTRTQTLDSKAFGVKLDTGLSPHQNALELADLKTWRIESTLEQKRVGNTVTVIDPHSSNRLQIDIVPDPANPMLVRFRMHADLDQYTGDGFKRKVSGFVSELGLSLDKGKQTRNGGYSYTSEKIISSDGDWNKLTNNVQETRMSLFDADRTYRNVMKEAMQKVTGGDTLRSSIAEQVISGINVERDTSPLISAVKPGDPDPLNAYYTPQERKILGDAYHNPEFGKSSHEGFKLQLRADGIRSAVFERQILAVETSRFHTLADHLVKKGEISSEQARDLVDEFRMERGKNAAGILEERIKDLKQKSSITLSLDEEEEFKNFLKQSFKPRSEHIEDLPQETPDSHKTSAHNETGADSKNIHHEAAPKSIGGGAEVEHMHGKSKFAKNFGIVGGAVLAGQALLGGSIAQAATIVGETALQQIPIGGGAASEVIFGEGRRDEMALSSIEDGIQIAAVLAAPLTLGMSIAGSFVVTDVVRMGANLMGYNVDPSLIQTLNSTLGTQSDLATDSTNMILAMAYMNDLDSPEDLKAYEQAQEKADMVFSAKTSQEKAQLASDFLTEARVKIAQDAVNFVDKHYTQFPLEKLGVSSKAELVEMLMDKEGYKKIDQYSNASLREALNTEVHNIRDAMYMANNMHAHLVQTAAAEGITIQFGQEPHNAPVEIAQKENPASAPVITNGGSIGPG